MFRKYKSNVQREEIESKPNNEVDFDIFTRRTMKKIAEGISGIYVFQKYIVTT